MSLPLMRTHYIFAHGTQCSYSTGIEWKPVPANVIVVMNCEPITSFLGEEHYRILFDEIFTTIRDNYRDKNKFAQYISTIPSLFRGDINACVYFKEYPNIDIYFEGNQGHDLMNGLFELPITTTQDRQGRLNMENVRVANTVTSRFITANEFLLAKPSESKIYKLDEIITRFADHNDFHVIVTTACRSLKLEHEYLNKYPVVGESKMQINQGYATAEIHNVFLNKILAITNRNAHGGKKRNSKKTK